MNSREATSVAHVGDRGSVGLARRRYSEEDKKAMVAATMAPGATVTEVARCYGVDRSLLHNWRRQEAASLLGATVRFAPVQLVEASGKAAVGSSAGRIEIELPGEVRIRLEGTVDEEGLRRVLRALRA